jgi:hypothetical protein
MKVRAVKTFSGRYGLLRAGTEFECEPGYFQALKRNGLVQLATDRIAAPPADPNAPPGPGPGDNRSIPGAPKPGKDTPGEQRKPPGGTGHRKAAGSVTTSSSLRADLHSRGKTSGKSGGGALEKVGTLAVAAHVLGSDPADNPGSSSDTDAGGGE